MTIDPFDGWACISGQLIDNDSCQMSDEELATFCDQGAWRRNAAMPDQMAYAEAAHRGAVILKAGDKP